MVLGHLEEEVWELKKSKFLIFLKKIEKKQNFKKFGFLSPHSSASRCPRTIVRVYKTFYGLWRLQKKVKQIIMISRTKIWPKTDPNFRPKNIPDRFKTQLLSQVPQIVFGKSLSTSLNILCFHFLKVCVVCVKFIFLLSSLKFYCWIHCKPKKPNFFNLGPLCLPTTVTLSRAR